MSWNDDPWKDVFTQNLRTWQIFYLEKGSLQIKLSLWMKSSWINWVYPKCNDMSPYKKEGDSTQRNPMKMEATSEWCSYKPRNVKDHQQPPESRRQVGNGFFIGTFRRNWHLDFELLALGLWWKKFLFSTTWFVAVCSSNSRRSQPVRCTLSGTTCGWMNCQTACSPGTSATREQAYQPAF